LYKPQVKPGHWAKIHFFDSTLTCYIEAVSHSIMVDTLTGLLRKETTVTFGRGTLAHQDTPSYQYRLETRGSNPPGNPVKLVVASGAAGEKEAEGGGGDSTSYKKLQDEALRNAKPLPGGEAIMYTAGVPLLKPAKEQVSKEKKCIVIHYTNGNNVESMLNEFNQQQIYNNGESVYNTSTHYSVEKSGRIIQWLDPSKYAANHVAEAGFPAQSIGIDVVALPSQARTGLPIEQRRALKLLIDHLAAQYKIKKTVSKPNTYYLVNGKQKFFILTPEVLNASNKVTIERDMDSTLGKPNYQTRKGVKTSIGYTYTLKTVVDNNWGICRHRDFDATSCPGMVPIEDIVAMDVSGHTLTIQPFSPGDQAKLAALAVKYNLL
jgi:hypothetical protein